MTTLYLVRGLPGSGKSTLAGLLRDAILVEADDFFNLQGAHHFDASHLPAAHERCLQQTQQYLGNRQSVVVANTFTTLKELKPYFAISRAYLGKPPTVYLCQNNFGSVHDVPQETIDKMKRRFVYDLSPLYV